MLDRVFVDGTAPASHELQLVRQVDGEIRIPGANEGVESFDLIAG
jgi:hypothetical protein